MQGRHLDLTVSSCKNHVTSRAMSKKALLAQISRNCDLGEMYLGETLRLTEINVCMQMRLPRKAIVSDAEFVMWLLNSHSH